MRYSTEPKYRKYVKGYGFLSFARTFWDKYGKKLMDTATKLRIDAAEATSKKVAQKIAKVTGDLTGNKIADKITLVSKRKNEEKEDETNETQEIYIPAEKPQQIIDNSKLF